MNQNADSFDQFLTKLISQAKPRCVSLNLLHDTLISDHIIHAVKDDSLRKRLLSNNPDLNKCVEMCKAEEVKMGIQFPF